MMGETEGVFSLFSRKSMLYANSLTFIATLGKSMGW